MDSTFFKRILLAWMAVPLTALDWAIAWRKLPEQVVMKYGSSGRPLSWAPRAAAMRFELSLMAGVIGFGTVLAFLVALTAPWKGPQVAGVVLVIGVFMLVLMSYVLWFHHVP